MELLEHSMGFLCAMIYNKLTCTSKRERPPPNLWALPPEKETLLLQKRAIPYPTLETPIAQCRPLLPKLGVHRKILKIS